MRIRYRIFVGFALVLVAVFFFLVDWILSDVNIQPRKAMEESMVDTAHILAAFLEARMTEPRIPVDEAGAVLDAAGRREFRAQIYELGKTGITSRVYITDKQGIVLYDSQRPENVGRDFSTWLDVSRTLRGQYGARTSRDDPGDPLSSVAYVAAPVRFRGDIVGVCTVAKSWRSINSFLETARRKIVTLAVLGLLVILGLSFLIAYWITTPLQRLTEYARAVRDGLRPVQPRLGSGEARLLGDAFEEMRVTLEGRNTIEHYIQTMTHQLKGPLSAVRAAAELLQEEMPAADRKSFAATIVAESARIQQIIDRLLELAVVEAKSRPEHIEEIDLAELARDAAAGLAPLLAQKDVRLEVSAQSARIRGERFLVHQALLNILQNAVDFSPPQGVVRITLAVSPAGRVSLSVCDEGPGIPDFALDKIFDRFYSLPRPGQSRKSSGLGLTLVQEVMTLHNGRVTVVNQPAGGVIATLEFPAAVR